MGDFRISGKNVITQSGTAEPVLASNVTLGTGIIKSANIIDAATTTLSCTTTNASITVATAATSSLSLGMAVSGTNIPANAHIVTIPNATSFTITSAATGAATVTLTFRTGITSAKIEDDAVTAAKIVDDAVTSAKIVDDAVTSAKVSGLVKGDVGLGNVDNTTDALKPVSTAATTALALKANQSALDSLSVADADAVPHMILGKLYPAVAGKLMDGSTSHSGAYGTAQADTFKYYYTDIKGSKPIKDPRIGAHFGSQRHKIKSLQLLEQETAMHGKNVYSIDGRDWLRGVDDWGIQNNARGNHLRMGPVQATTGVFMEVTGYFNKLNLLNYNEGSRAGFDYHVDGGSATQTNDTQFTAIASPLDGRYVDPMSVHTINIGTIALGIHTVKFIKNNTTSNGQHQITGIELIAHGLFTDATCDYNNDPTIAHDANTKMVVGMSVTGTGIPTGATIASVTSTTAFELSASTTGGSVTNGTLTFSVADIQIPPQNVVSFGKKFTVAEVAQHYDPFNGFVNSTSLHSAFVDTATSLGLSTPIALHGAPWAISGSNNIRPYNGGRVVKWIANDGTIKTSVNMMPPNAQNLSTTAAVEITTPSATNVYLPAFSNDAVDHSLAEVAKTFHWREFGNGAANQGTGGSKADATMLDGGTADNVAYVMDDGLTSFSGYQLIAPSNTYNFFDASPSDYWYYTFIGTGFSMKGMNWSQNAFVHQNFAQNLPYGTHVFKCIRSGSTITFTLDGVTIKTGSSLDGKDGVEMTIHQPKMPPIPEDAVVIADYMLMADFVQQTIGDELKISKGVRLLSASRDIVFKDGTWPLSSGTHIQIEGTGDGDQYITAFADNATLVGYNLPGRSRPFEINGSVVSTTKNGSTSGSIMYATNAGDLPTLGVNKFGTDGSGSSSIDLRWYQFASPIHTSSHYQTFETPFLHELVGGDRNMEQTNLVVTPDGKTWDEVTRDTSYIGAEVHRWGWTGNHQYGNNTSPGDNLQLSSSSYPWVCRGKTYAFDYGNKNFAFAYDRHICLVDGTYLLHCQSYHENNWGHWYVQKNGSSVTMWSRNSQNDVITTADVLLPLKRGDYIQVDGGHRIDSNSNLQNFYMVKV